MVHNFQYFYILIAVVVCSYLPKRRSLPACIVLFLLSLATLFLFPVESELFYERFLQEYLPPFLIVATYLVIGREMDRRATETAEFALQLDESKKSSKDILDKFQHINEIKENLEKRIFKDEDFVLKLQEAVSDMASMDYEEIKTKILEMGVEFCRAISISLYTFKSSRFELQSSFNSPDNLPKEYLEDSLFYQRLMAHKGILTARELRGAGHPEVIMACKLTTRRGDCIGAVIINDMDFLDLNTTNMRLFRMLCNWTSLEIEKALRYQNQQFDIIKLRNFGYFLQMVYNELLHVRNKSTTALILTLTIPDSELLHPEKKEELIGSLSGLIFEHFPEQKAMFFNELKGERFHVVLTDTDFEDANQTVQKFSTHLENLNFKPYTDHRKSLILRSDLLYLDRDTTEETIESFVEEQSSIEAA